MSPSHSSSLRVIGGFVYIMTVMTIVTVICGGFLDAGVHLPFAGSLERFVEHHHHSHFSIEVLEW
jgi:hypothetical protein